MIEDPDEIEAADAMERALLRGGRRRAALAAVWSFAVGIASAFGWLAYTIYRNAPLIDWWVR